MIALFARLEHASPDAAVLLLTVGLALIAVELNRPGMILPGAGGLLVVLCGAYALQGEPLTAWALGLVLLAAGVLLANLYAKVPLPVLLLATGALAAGLRFLVGSPGQQQVHLGTAVVCGLSLGAAGAFLSRVALRARRAKRVN